jgi:hypothetical protein
VGVVAELAVLALFVEATLARAATLALVVEPGIHEDASPALALLVPSSPIIFASASTYDEPPPPDHWFRGWWTHHVRSVAWDAIATD